MKSLLRKTFNGLMICSAILCCTFPMSPCSRGSKTIEKNEHMNRQLLKLENAFKTTRRVCFGRFDIEVPTTSTVIYGPAYIEEDIGYYKGEASKIDDHLKKRKLKIEEFREIIERAGSTSLPKFGTVEDGARAGQKFLYSTSDFERYDIESYVPVGDDLFVLEYKEVFDLSEAHRTLNNVALSLRTRRDDEIPQEPGMCIEGGFSTYDTDFEGASIGVRLAEFPDVHFSISTRRKDILVESDALEPLLIRAEKDAQREGLGHIFKKIKTLRRGNRQLGDWNGFEILARKPAYGPEKENHEFRFVSMAIPKDGLHPYMEIQMDSGVKDNTHGAVRPSVSDEEALAIWDKLTGSLRIRPTSATVKP